MDGEPTDGPSNTLTRDSPSNSRSRPSDLDRTPANLPAPIARKPAEIAFEALRRKLLWISGLRVLMMVVLAGSTLVVTSGGGFPLLGAMRATLLWAALGSLVPASLYFPAVYAANTMRGLRLVAIAQVTQDSLFSAFLVASSGGTGSAFTFFFSLTIVIAGTLIGRLGTVLSVAYSALLLVLLALLQTRAIEPPMWLAESLPPGSLSSVGYEIGINLVAIVSIGFLSSYLAEALRRSDIQRERYRSTLEDLRQLHESILASVESGIVTCRLDYRILHMNRASELLLGVAFGQVKGRKLGDVMPDIASPVADGQRRFDLAKRGRDGRERQLMVVVTPLLSRAGEMSGQILVVEDVSLIKAMEARMKADERLTTIGKLSAVVAHEIRNPLAAISASAQMLAAGGVPDEDRGIVDIVVREADRLNLWITDLLDYARPRKGEVLDVDLAELLGQTLELVRGDPAAARVRFSSDVQAGVRVKGDPQRLLRVFLNRGKNAVEAMGEEGGLVMVRCWDEQAADRRWAVVSFVDSGCGIAAEDLSRVFDAFFTTKTGGTGLGLATVQQVVEEHGGTVTVTSEPGVRTEFLVRLPALPA